MSRPSEAALSGWVVVEAREDHTTLKIIEAIRCNATGEIRERESCIYWWHRDDGPHTFIWSDGNFSCDCSRAQFFAAAAGEPDPNISCSDGLFSVRLTNWKTGEVFYDEFEDET